MQLMHMQGMTMPAGQTGNAEAAEAVLARWLERERAVTASATGDIGVATREQLAGRSGAQVFADILAGDLPRPPINQTLDFLLVECEPRRAVFQGTPGPQHYNPMGTVHGGWFATLLDSALGCAVHSALPAGRGYTTLELKVNMVRALTAKVQRVRAEGQVIHLGRQVATAEARLVGPDGTLYGHATTTCLVFDLPG
jgi:uncharacterized protein (TIGR00369 family)